MKNNNNNNNNITKQNHNKSQQPEGSNLRAKKRRTGDSIIVGIGFSLAFVLLLSKVAHTTPCETLEYLNIETKTCTLVSNSSTTEGQIATQHGLGFAIIIEYVLLALELTDVLNDHVQQFLQNIGLQ
jgi:hypothetical protein